MRKITLVLTFLCALVLTSVAQSGPQFVWAAKYNQWALGSVSPNTYTFQATTSCIADPYSGRSYNFNTNAPVYINDLGLDANSEVVTPTSVINNVGTCGFAASPTHPHIGFQVQSGTAGLQEALNAILGGSSTNQFVVMLDASWHGQANSITGTSDSAIIAAAKGSTKINLVDVSTAPWTVYVWNGAAYIASSYGGSTNYGAGVGGQFLGYRNTGTTPLAAPTAGAFATALNSSGIAAGTYRLAQTCVDPLGGETLISDDSSSTVTTDSTHGTITAAAPTCAAGSVGWRLYISAASGAANSELLYSPTAAGCTASVQGVRASCALTSGASVSALVTLTSKVPTKATAFAMSIVGQDTNPTPFLKSWPAFAVSGVETAATTYTVAQFHVAPGYLNQVGKTIQVCGNFNLTPSATGTDVLAITAANSFGQSPNTLVSWTSGALTNAAYEAPFCFTLTVTVAGASGTAEVHGFAQFALASTGVAPFRGYTDGNVAAVTLGDLTKGVTFSVTSTPGTSDVTQGQVRQLVVTPLN